MFHRSWCCTLHTRKCSQTWSPCRHHTDGSGVSDESTHTTMNSPAQNEAVNASCAPSGCSGFSDVNRFDAGDLSSAHITARSPSFMMGVSSILRTRNTRLSGCFTLETPTTHDRSLCNGTSDRNRGHLAAGCGDAPKPAETKPGRGRSACFGRSCETSCAR